MIYRMVIKCDFCDFRKEVANDEEMLSWQNVPCPKCGQGVIVNDADAFAIRHLKLVDTVIETTANVLSLFNIDMPKQAYLDTGPMRTGGRAKLRFFTPEEKVVTDAGH